VGLAGARRALRRRGGSPPPGFLGRGQSPPPHSCTRPATQVASISSAIAFSRNPWPDASHAAPHAP
jgi:hypothetical protein